jgi:hypothetical protein
MEDEKIDKEEVWSAIRYLDPDERQKDKEVNTATIIATLALLIIVGGLYRKFMDVDKRRMAQFLASVVTLITVVLLEAKVEPKRIACGHRLRQSQIHLLE